MAQTTLSENQDQRLSPFSCNPGMLDCSTLYNLLKAKGHPADPVSEFIWKSKTPPRLQLFKWLLTKEKIQCRANLFRKKVVDSHRCGICGNKDETPTHIVFLFPFATMFWNALVLQLAATISTTELHSIQKLQSIPATQYGLLLCWQVWERRNGIVFRIETLSYGSCSNLGIWKADIVDIDCQGRIET